MDAGNQQRILGYFIEEAKEHLDTIEKGLLNLRSVIKEPERVNEMFRAAHSVKGGAAMLGFASIQKTSHRLEDAFKILKDNDLNVDRKLETLFLQVYDTLKDLVEQLQGPFGLREEDAQKTMQAAEQKFTQLDNYINHLLGGTQEGATVPATQNAAAPAALSPNFTPQATDTLKQMLQLFKQEETPASRQKLQALCKRLAQLGKGVAAWQTLLQTVFKAISNPKNSYQTLAPVVIKELKQASDQLQTGKESAIAVSKTLQQLASAAPAATPSATSAANTASKEITVTLEPKAAAKALIQAFDKQQLTQLVKLLIQATRTSS